MGPSKFYPSHARVGPGVAMPLGVLKKKKKKKKEEECQIVIFYFGLCLRKHSDIIH